MKVLPPKLIERKPKLEVFTRSYRERVASTNKNLEKFSITVPNMREMMEEEVEEYEEVEVAPSVQSRLGLSRQPTSKYVLVERAQQPLLPTADVEEYIEEVEEWEEDVESLNGGVQTRYVATPVVPTAVAKVDPRDLSLDQLMQKDPKFAQRCSYWPACRSGDKCPLQAPLPAL